MSTPLLQVKNLCTSFDVDAGEVRAVNGISFSLDKGKVLGIVGRVRQRQERDGLFHHAHSGGARPHQERRNPL